MARAFFLLTLLSYWSGVTSQPTLTQPPSEAVAPREMVKLSCTVSSNKNTICWVQQRSGERPHYIQCAGYNRGDGVPDRFTASDSGNVGTLTITNTQPEDEADYYCYMWYSSGSQYVFGGGTQLTVLSQAKAAPAVFVYPPSSEEVAAQNKATLVCLMNNFYPGAVQVTWKADNAKVTEGVETTRPSKQSDNRYLASSYLFLSATDWASHNNYTCQVTHEGVDYEASVDRLECP